MKVFFDGVERVNGRSVMRRKWRRTEAAMAVGVVREIGEVKRKKKMIKKETKVKTEENRVYE